MDYVESLRQRAKETGSIVCMGMDPVEADIPQSITGTIEQRITKFYMELLGAITSGKVPLACVKPNIAFYEQFGEEGLSALKKLIPAYQQAGIPVILDAKRGDIGKTSIAYSKSAFDIWAGDALTVAPYMGFDSVGPFVERCADGKGVYVLCRTSNPGAADLQGLELADGRKVFMATAELIAGKWYQPGICAVVGATSPDELAIVSEYFVGTGKSVPLLIPGVGKQGGSAADVVAALKRTGNELAIHRINSSSEINFAYKKTGTDDYAGAAVEAIKKLNKEIGPVD